MLDQSFIGHEFLSFTAEVEKGRLKFFAQAIGETDPIYTDEGAARAAGHPTLPAPPTFSMALDMERKKSWKTMTMPIAASSSSAWMMA